MAHCVSQVKSVPQIDVCFHILELILKHSLPKAEKLPETFLNQNNLSPLSLSSFASLLTGSLFTSPLVLSLLGLEEVGGRGRGKERGGERDRGEGRIEMVCLKGLGRLLSAALVASEEFRSSPLFQRLFHGLLERILDRSCGENEDISEYHILQIFIHFYIESTTHFFISTFICV